MRCGFAADCKCKVASCSIFVLQRYKHLASAQYRLTLNLCEGLNSLKNEKIYSVVLLHEKALTESKCFLVLKSYIKCENLFVVLLLRTRSFT